MARCGTLSAAAASLNIGIATLSRRIDRLEAALKMPLFVRQQTGYQLTQDGKQLIDKAEAMEASALAFTAGAEVHATVSGRVCLATAENLASALILPALPKFIEQYPNLLIELVTDINTVNLHQRDADLAIRMVKPERGNINFRRLGTLGFGLYASGSYVEKRAARRNVDNFENDAFISWNEMQSHLAAAKWIERVLRGRPPAITTTSLSCQIAAATAGLGIAVLPHFLAANAGLICLAPDIGLDQPIYLVIQTDIAQSRRARVLADFLSDLVIENHDKLQGQTPA
ncbi:MAG: LysR family transcriptional regulator [Cellvibrionaceae bacterium]|nr:LysR family transcriptional regulator [Cellvibrionaceae bacterium]